MQTTRRDSIKGILGAFSAGLIGTSAPWVPTRAVAAAPATPQTLTYAVTTFGGEALDPIIAKGDLITVLTLVFDSLFEVNANGQFVPGLLTKWDMSPDAKVWTLHLREGVVFHDGSPFTAEDVVFTLQRAESEEAMRGGLWREILGVPLKAEVVDKYTVRVTTPNPQPHLAAFATHVATPYMFVLPKAYTEKNGVDYFRKHPVGTGPYKFVKLVPGQQMDFEAVDYAHWRVNPQFKNVRILEVPEETTRIAMLETGSIDVAGIDLSNAARVKKDGYHLVSGQNVAANVYFVGSYLPEAKGMPLGDSRVRQALSLAINRQEIVDTLLDGQGTADVINIGLDWQSTPDWTPELVTKWKTQAKKMFRYDPVEAKRLIAEAGYPNGFDFTFWLAPKTTLGLTDVMQAVTGYWTAVGARAKLVQVDATAWNSARHTGKSKQLVGAGGAGTNDLRNIGADSFKFFTSKYGNMNMLAGSPLEAKVDALSVKGWTAVDPAENASTLDQLLETTTHTWAGWPMFIGHQIVAVGPRVKGDLSRDLLNQPYSFAYWEYVAAK